MAICIPVGSCKLFYRAVDLKGQGCRRAQWDAGIAFKRCLQDEFSRYGTSIPSINDPNKLQFTAFPHGSLLSFCQNHVC